METAEEKRPVTLDEELLDQLALVYAHAALDRLLAEQEKAKEEIDSTTTRGKCHDEGKCI